MTAGIGVTLKLRKPLAPSFLAGMEERLGPATQTEPAAVGPGLQEGPASSLPLDKTEVLRTMSWGPNSLLLRVTKLVTGEWMRRELSCSKRNQ